VATIPFCEPPLLFEFLPPVGFFAAPLCFFAAPLLARDAGLDAAFAVVERDEELVFLAAAVAFPPFAPAFAF